MSHYVRYEKELNMTGISYPVQVNKIPKFENQNDISINVFGYENDEFFPIHISQQKDRDAFYNDLTKIHLADEDYEHAKMVWDTFEIEDMGSYHDLYLKSDVLLLNCVFERFRDQCMEIYGLDPAHFYTCPGLAWSAALKVAKCKLELITEDNAEAYLFIESGLRGGISQISNRLATANNEYLDNTYDSERDSSYLLYQDCNNLYDLALSMPLPTGEFKFLSEEERINFNVLDVGKCSDKGYVLEVDLDYPKELHDLHSDYPLAPETNRDHFLFDNTNAKKPGLFKDETGGVPIEKFVGLRSKMYSLTYGDVEQKRAKGIVKSVVRRELKHSNYVSCILDQKTLDANKI
ncbi:Hypothetical predicted protein [Mytilus galloprovincialis]|uniref:DNA-directed DNA polymerase n=1 Tax=Mytilus galloprovincialis TaxID=29158 RepID=A0A8B6F8B9_MYTGA|nr:Hypothetical predicted protein [Mytilus galloprovincialis]